MRQKSTPISFSSAEPPTSPDPGPTISLPALVVSWLWIGVACLLLLDVRARLFAAHANELLLLWAFEDFWRAPVLIGLSNERALLLVNPLFVVLLWAASRAPVPGGRLATRGLTLRRFAHLGTALVLLALHHAFASVAQALPQWTVSPLP